MIEQKSSQFQLIGDRILLKKDERSQQGAILLPGVEKDQTAIVVSVGSEVKRIKPGYRVLVGMFTGTDYEFEDGKFTMCLEEHIMGIQTE
jgi:co-chaperonin GroES (HSP10)